MGKGKRTNPGVGVDFRKVKHKVGKKLPKAQNDTRTDFKSRSINLPNQSVGQDKAGAAVSERNLTLKVWWMSHSELYWVVQLMHVLIAWLPALIMLEFKCLVTHHWLLAAATKLAVAAAPVLGAKQK
eukprot:GHRR01034111.1.p1 GENE.GHRR01034111.1~~GHRR01034111.1.p1  ORF type:complete len:127 (+),score=41.61 GHRR01034111.1:379-759(+)